MAPLQTFLIFSKHDTRVLERPAWAAVLALSLAACGGPGLPAQPSIAPLAGVRQLTAGLGPVVQSKFGGQIFGWDIDQNGSDGVLTETAFEQNGSFINAIETFDESTGKITKVVQKRVRLNADVEPVVDAIAGDDVGIIDVARDFALKRDDRFDIMNPVSGGRITARSVPPQDEGMVPNFVTNNQASSNQLMMALYPKKHGLDSVGMYTYDTATGAWGKRFDFPNRELFQTGFPNYAAVDATTDEAVTGYLIRSRYNPHESPTFYVMDAAPGSTCAVFTASASVFRTAWPSIRRPTRCAPRRPVIRTSSFISCRPVKAKPCRFLFTTARGP